VDVVSERQFIGNQKYIPDWENTLFRSSPKLNRLNVLQIYTCDSKNTNQKWLGDPNPDNER
jgi:hypothetical protein